MQKKSLFVNKIAALEKVCSNIVVAYQVLKPTRWMPLNVAMYISKYMEQHPGKKLTRRLERKLEREFYRSLRSDKK